MIYFIEPDGPNYLPQRAKPPRTAPRHMTPEEFIDEIATQVEDRLMWHSMALIGGLIAVSAVLGVILGVMA